MPRRMPPQQGQAVVIVLVVMLVLQVVAWAFLSRMNMELRLAGGSTRGLSALYLAEGGLQKVLHTLEVGVPDGSAGAWPRAGMPLGPGTFTVEAVDHLPDGLVSIVVRGEVGGARRRVKALATVGPQALAYGIFAQGAVTLAGASRTYLIPHLAGREDCRRMGDLAAGGEIRFNSPRAALNAFGGVRLSLREGDIPDTALLSDAGLGGPGAGLVDLVLAGGARLISGLKHAAVGLEELRGEVAELGVRRALDRTALPTPSVDPAYYRALAEANTANASINEATGKAGLEPGLRDKAHSRYSVEEFEAILEYLYDQPESTLTGVIVVEGDVYLARDRALTIIDGALVVRGDIAIGPGARLKVHHRRPARRLAGLVAWGAGTIQIDAKAEVQIDGLMLAAGDVIVLASVLDVKGAVAAKNVFTRDGRVVVRYDPRVLAAAGLQSTGRGLATLVSWQELP